MKEWKSIILMVCLVVCTISLAIIAANCSYGALELRGFNKLNGTNYTMDQWRIYEYEIKKLHPFNDQR